MQGEELYNQWLISQIGPVSYNSSVVVYCSTTRILS